MSKEKLIIESIRALRDQCEEVWIKKWCDDILDQFHKLKEEEEDKRDE